MALTAARMAAWEWDPKADTAVISDTVADVFGLQPGDTIQSSVQAFEIIHPEDRQRHHAILQEAIKEVRGYHSVYRIVRPIDGVIAWMEEHGTARIDPATGRVRMAGVVMDISQRKGEEEMRARLAAVVQSSDDAIITKTLDGIITTWNEGPRACSAIRRKK